MILRALLFAAASFVWTACGNVCDRYPPPVQRLPVMAPPPASFGHFVAVSDENAADYLVQGFAPRGPESWRWAEDRATLRFHLPYTGRVNFTMDFTLPPVTFRKTGPVTLAFFLNGRSFDRVRYDQAGDHRFSREVPPGFLYENATNVVAIHSDKVWVSPDDGLKHGFILVRAGFTE